MANREDDDSRTEEATEKRKAEAREEGNTPSTPEASVFATLLASTIAIAVLLPSIADRMSYDLKLALENAGSLSLRNSHDAGALLGAITTRIAAELVVLVGLFVSVGIVVIALQGAPIVAFRRVMPKADHLSPMRGISRIFGRQAVTQIIKTTVKLVIITILAVWLVSRDLGQFERFLLLDVMALPAELVRSTGFALAMVTAAAALIFAADSSLAIAMWRRALRMTKQEVSREQRELEGEPLLKARRRAISRARSRRRMMAAVPKATMVIVNPTHYAVALRYSPELDGAPRVMAKGQDLMALAIRRIAMDHNIPLVEDKALARSLYSSVEVDQQIPPEFYRAIAVIVATIDRHRRVRQQ